jgi:serine/threonine protein kinase
MLLTAGTPAVPGRTGRRVVRRKRPGVVDIRVASKTGSPLEMRAARCENKPRPCGGHRGDRARDLVETRPTGDASLARSEDTIMITPKAGVVIAGRYTLLRLLGCGGMGSVWLARDRGLEIDVAVKFMDPAFVSSSEARMRFEREAKMVAGLSSQHIVQVRDYGLEDGTPYIILELLKGESLSARIAREDRFSPAVAARLLVPICKALRTAHEAGIVHRDLKPANIFLALQDDDEVVKLLDFGIAKATRQVDVRHPTVTGAMLGSIHYMSPEQIRSSRHVDHRADLWSVGVILYRMLTGHLPFSSVSPGDLLVRVCTDVCPPPSSSRPELSKEIDAFFARALALDPAQRFQSALALQRAFSAVALEPPPAPPLPVQCWESTIVLTSASTQGADEGVTTTAFPLLLAACPQVSSVEAPTGLESPARERSSAPSWADVPTLVVPVSTADTATAIQVEPRPVAQETSPLVFSRFSNRQTGTLAWWVVAAMVALAAILWAVLCLWVLSASPTEAVGVEPLLLPLGTSLATDSLDPPATAESPVSLDTNGSAPAQPWTASTVQLPVLVVTGSVAPKPPPKPMGNGTRTPYDEDPAADLDNPYR